MHADEVDVPETLVRALVDSQFPEWAGLPLRPVAAFGTDHRLFRLGEELLVRMPVYAGSADQAMSDATWLPRLAPHLPSRYRRPWRSESRTRPTRSRGRWCRGCRASRSTTPAADRSGLAEDLAEFVARAASGRPVGGPRPSGTARGMPLDPRVGGGATASSSTADLVDVDRARAVWHAALDAGPWHGSRVWIHGDLLGGNLLVRDGRLSAVIDWGPLKVADPAPDVVPAWTLFEGACAAHLPRAAGRGRRHLGAGAGLGDAARAGRRPLLREVGPGVRRALAEAPGGGARGGRFQTSR